MQILIFSLIKSKISLKMVSRVRRKQQRISRLTLIIRCLLKRILSLLMICYRLQRIILNQQIHMLKIKRQLLMLWKNNLNMVSLQVVQLLNLPMLVMQVHQFMTKKLVRLLLISKLQKILIFRNNQNLNSIWLKKSLKLNKSIKMKLLPLLNYNVKWLLLMKQGVKQFVLKLLKSLKIWLSIMR